MDAKRFIALYDMHWGYERKNGHKVPMHDAAAINIALEFAKDFQPDVVIVGGDGLDLSAISHHNRQKPGRTEGLRVLTDAQEFAEKVITPLNALNAEGYVYIEGNHEIWLRDLVDESPGLEGIVNLDKLLPLDNWKIIPQGGHFNLGRLTFIHGDQLSGGEFAAKAAVIAYEKSVRFGHFHSQQTYSKNTPFDEQYPKTGICVGCLCKKSPHYGKGKPNRWSQGFLWGYVLPDGSYFDYPTTIIKGKSIINGKLYGTK